MTNCKCGHSATNHNYRASDRKFPCLKAQFGYDNEGHPIGKTCHCNNYSPVSGATQKPGPISKQDRTAEPKFHAGHRIEEHVKVYLVLTDDGTGWAIDATTFDGFPLDGLKDGPVPTESDCECDNREQCWEAHNYAAYLPLPTGQELVELLNQYGSVTNG